MLMILLFVRPDKALIKNNAKVAAQVAVELCGMQKQKCYYDGEEIGQVVSQF